MVAAAAGREGSQPLCPRPLPGEGGTVRYGSFGQTQRFILLQPEQLRLHQPAIGFIPSRLGLLLFVCVFKCIYSASNVYIIKSKGDDWIPVRGCRPTPHEARLRPHPPPPYPGALLPASRLTGGRSAHVTRPLQNQPGHCAGPGCPSIIVSAAVWVCVCVRGGRYHPLTGSRNVLPLASTALKRSRLHFLHSKLKSTGRESERFVKLETMQSHEWI